MVKDQSAENTIRTLYLRIYNNTLLKTLTLICIVHNSPYQLYYYTNYNCHRWHKETPLSFLLTFLFCTSVVCHVLHIPAQLWLYNVFQPHLWFMAVISLYSTILYLFQVPFSLLICCFNSLKVLCYEYLRKVKKHNTQHQISI